MQSYWILFFLIVILFVTASERRHLMFSQIRRKRKGVKRKMPTEMMKEFIGQLCTITLYNEAFAVRGTIATVEENWIKVVDKKTIRIINGDMIQDICIVNNN